MHRNLEILTIDHLKYNMDNHILIVVVYVMEVMSDFIVKIKTTLKDITT